MGWSGGWPIAASRPRIRAASQSACDVCLSSAAPVGVLRQG